MRTYSSRSRSPSPTPVKKYAGLISPQRKQFLHHWIRILLPSTKFPAEDSIRNGTLPYKLIQDFVPNFTLKGFNSSPNSTQSYTNIHILNNYLFSEFPNSELPSPSEILNKTSSDCWVLANTIYKNFQSSELRKSWEKCIDWYKSILKFYGIEAQKQFFIKECFNGVYFACVLNCYAGLDLKEISIPPVSADPVASPETAQNLVVVFNFLKNSSQILIEPQDFLKNTDEELVCLVVFRIFKQFRCEVPNLPVQSKVFFKKSQNCLNTTDSSLSLSSMGSLEYSRSTMLSKGPSEYDLFKKTPKWHNQDFQSLPEESTGLFTQPQDVSFEAVSVANTSYTKSTAEKLMKLEKANALCERKLMCVADLRRKKEASYRESPKKLKFPGKGSEQDILCYLVVPRVVFMIKPEAENVMLAVRLEFEKHKLKNESYWVEWKDMGLKVKGKISMNDILYCESNAKLLILRTASSSFTFQCSDENDAFSYAYGIKKLSKSFSWFSKDSSCKEFY